MNHKYTQEHVDFLRENIEGTPFKDLTEMFNKRFGLDVSMNSVVSLADRHGLHNKRITLMKGWEPTQFKKGHTPFNKGKKGLTSANKTSFKKGNKPHNWVPIGSERITKDGYIQIKVQEGKQQHNWKSKHILIWEEHNGPVPKGHKVIFGDGNLRNFDINNLILVTDAQMLFLNRNGLVKNDAEITKVGIVLSDLAKKLYERSKK